MAMTTAERSRLYRERHPDRVKDSQLKYAKTPRSKERYSRYRKKDIERTKSRDRKWNSKRYWANPRAENMKRKERNKKNPEARKAVLSRYYEVNKDKILARAREMYSPVKHREKSYKRKYGLDLNGYVELLEAQNGACAICAGAHSDGRPLYVDHDHSTGKVRGLLCMGCNGGLGCFGDIADLVKRAATYLEERS